MASLKIHQLRLVIFYINVYNSSVPTVHSDFTSNMCVMRFLNVLCIAHGALGLDKSFDEVLPQIRKIPKYRREAMGLLRQEYENLPGQHHRRFMTAGELMDPLELRSIDPLPNTTALVDEVNYLRSIAVEGCRELVCSTQGRKRFAACANSVLSVDKQCQPDCQDHLNMWVLNRCYMVETFDCAGNIGPNSVDSSQSVFNQGGPQTLPQFQESVTSLFASKGVNCQCCDVSDVVLVQQSSFALGGASFFAPAALLFLLLAV